MAWKVRIWEKVHVVRFDSVVQWSSIEEVHWSNYKGLMFIVSRGTRICAPLIQAALMLYHQPMSPSSDMSENSVSADLVVEMNMQLVAQL